MLRAAHILVAVSLSCCVASDTQCLEGGCSSEEPLNRESDVSLLQVGMSHPDNTKEEQDTMEEAEGAAEEVSPTAHAMAVAARISEKVAAHVAHDVSDAMTPKSTDSKQGTGNVPAWFGTASVNHSELAYLAGIPTLNNNRDMSDMGWVLVSPVVKDPNQKLEPGVDDILEVWRKKRICAIIFSATDDVVDLKQAAKTKKTAFCGFNEVRYGFVEEQRGFFAAEAWGKSVGLLTPQHCDHIYSVGHSMGGGSAALFAYCTNRPPIQNKDKAKYKAITQEVKLVTFGSGVPTYKPFYNKEPGRCFKGSRYYLQGVPAKPWTSGEYQDMGKMFWSSLRMISYNPKATQLMAEIKKTGAKLKDAEKKKAKAKELTLQVLLNKHLLSALLLVKSSKNMLAMNNVKTFVLSHQPMFSYEYDPVPDAGTYNGFVHPLMSSVGLPHPLSPHKWAPNAVKPHKDEPEDNCASPLIYKAPFHNHLRSDLGAMGLLAENGPSFPNHFICCYARALGDKHTKCGKTFKIGGYITGCIEPRWR